MVSKEEVKKVAENARINLTVEETQNFKEEFVEVMEIFNTLEEVDTEDTEPAFHPVDVKSNTRKDKVKKTLTRKEIFQNTENQEKGYFKGPKI